VALAHREAILQNAKTLKHKHMQNSGIIIA